MRGVEDQAVFMRTRRLKCVLHLWVIGLEFHFM